MKKYTPNLLQPRYRTKLLQLRIKEVPSARIVGYALASAPSAPQRRSAIRSHRRVRTRRRSFCSAPTKCHPLASSDTHSPPLLLLRSNEVPSARIVGYTLAAAPSALQPARAATSSKLRRHISGGLVPCGGVASPSSSSFAAKKCHPLASSGTHSSPLLLLRNCCNCSA